MKSTQYWQKMKDHSLDGYELWEHFKAKIEPWVEQELKADVIQKKIEKIKIVKKFITRQAEFEWTKANFSQGFGKCYDRTEKPKKTTTETKDTGETSGT